MSKASIIILNYNGYKETDKLAMSLLNWSLSLLDFNVVIVDNCSTDDSFDKLQKKYSSFDRYDVIRSDHNGGYSYGNNYGALYSIKKYNPQYIAIANPDVILEEEMFIGLLKTFDADSRIGMCAPVMTFTDGSYTIKPQRIPTYFDDLRACFSEKNESTFVNLSYLNNDHRLLITEMVPGSFFVIKTSCFVEIGYFDENVFLYCEERILGKRLKMAGYKVLLRTDLFYVHAHAVSISNVYNIVDRWKILLNSRLYYQKKYDNIGRLYQLILRSAMFYYLVKLRMTLQISRFINSNEDKE